MGTGHLRCVALALLAAAAAPACRTASEDTRWSKHFDWPVWSQGLTRQAEDPTQWRTEAALGVATLALIPFDSDLSEDSPHHYLTAGNTFSGDIVSLGLGAGALAYGAWNYAEGDHGESLEVGAESLAATAAATQLLKVVTGRQRPQGSSSNDSFPSGHSSFAFAAATFFARQIERETGSSLGYMFYLPATYVAIDRVEGERHWATDVAAGALLGVFLTNWIFNAHNAEPGDARPAIFDHRPHVAWTIQPQVIDDRPTLGITFAF